MLTKLHSNTALIAADIAYWPAMPRTKSMQPAIAKSLDSSDFSAEKWLDYYSVNKCHKQVQEVKVSSQYGR